MSEPKNAERDELAGLVECKCRNCRALVLRPKVEDWTDDRCFDCIVLDITGLRDVRAIARGFDPAIEFAAFTHENGSALWRLKLSTGDRWVAMTRTEFEERFLL